MRQMPGENHSPGTLVSGGRIMTIQSPPSSAVTVKVPARLENRRSLLSQIWTSRWCYIFMTPGIILTAMFTFYPIIYSWYLSLHQYAGFKAAPYYIGLDNYRESINDSFFARSHHRKRLCVFMSIRDSKFQALVCLIPAKNDLVVSQAKMQSIPPALDGCISS